MLVVNILFDLSVQKLVVARTLAVLIQNLVYRIAALYLVEFRLNFIRELSHLVHGNAVTVVCSSEQVVPRQRLLK